MLTGLDREVPPIDHVQRIDDVFSDLHTTPSAVYDIVSSLKVGKSPGHDDIPPCLLRACAKGISSSLAGLFNLSFTRGKVLAEWKKALVVPVFKRGDKSLPTNYRPISLLCIVSKVQEPSSTTSYTSVYHRSCHLANLASARQMARNTSSYGLSSNGVSF